MWQNAHFQDLTPLLAAVCIAAAACSTPRVGAPEGSYTPARLAVVAAGSSGPVDCAIVRPEFFTANGVKPMLGRFFIASEYTAGQPGVVVLSRQYWDLRFQSRPEIIGTNIEVDGRQRVIIGVAPAEFQPDRAGLLWIPKTD